MLIKWRKNEFQDTHTHTHTHTHTEAYFISLVFLRKCRNKTKNKQEDPLSEWNNYQFLGTHLVEITVVILCYIAAFCDRDAILFR